MNAYVLLRMRQEGAVLKPCGKRKIGLVIFVLNSQLQARPTLTLIVLLLVDVMGHGLFENSWLWTPRLVHENQLTEAGFH